MDPYTEPINDDQAQSPEAPPELPAEISAEPPLESPFAALPAPEDSSLGWPIPAGGFATTAPTVPRPVSRLKYRAVVGSVVGGVVVLVVGVTAVHQFLNKAGTTKNFALVSPPPQALSGLSQDVQAESRPAYKAGVAKIRRHYSNEFGLPTTGSVIAVYQEQIVAAGSPLYENLVIYMGFQIPEHNDPARSLKLAMRKFSAPLINAAAAPVSGGVGDTSFDCVTDRGAKKLNALMLKMWPKLVHH
jgi:hypothetical protein